VEDSGRIKIRRLREIRWGKFLPADERIMISKASLHCKKGKKPSIKSNEKRVAMQTGRNKHQIQIVDRRDGVSMNHVA